MRRDTVDYVTIAGLIIFALLGIIYLNLETISNISFNFSVDPSSANISLPSINFDWWYEMDSVSKLIFSFLMLILIGCLLGSVGILVARKRVSDRK